MFYDWQHPEYDNGLGFTPNDIAVVQASSEISGDNISPGTIAPNADNPGGIGWITGWGRTCGRLFLTFGHSMQVDLTYTKEPTENRDPQHLRIAE